MRIRWNPFVKTSPITSVAMAALVVDALVDAELVRADQFDEAAAIAETEIRVRLSLGNTIVIAPS